MNVNFPDEPPDGVKGVLATRQGKRDLDMLSVDARRDPPGPEVRVAVGLDVETTGFGRRDEPLAAVELCGVEREASVAAGADLATDRLQLGPERVEGRHAAPP